MLHNINNLIKISLSIKENARELKVIPNPVIRWLLLISGTILLGVGIIGMFLPVLPTTVFFILAAWCYARSSEKFYNWLHSNKIFGKYLSNYRNGEGMEIKSKVITISILWIGILYSAVFATEILYIKILLILIAAGVTWHLISIKTKK